MSPVECEAVYCGILVFTSGTAAWRQVLHRITYPHLPARTPGKGLQLAGGTQVFSSALLMASKTRKKQAYWTLKADLNPGTSRISPCDLQTGVSDQQCQDRAHGVNYCSTWLSVHTSEVLSRLGSRQVSNQLPTTMAHEAEVQKPLGDTSKT
ncbi:hypothetical protein Bbelb_070040 [Branchiostoma belcheri]|nr:hypothetical protein Bbelb_070040 [Branchiostoma belcheri]